MLTSDLEREIIHLYEDIFLKNYFQRERHVCILAFSCLVHVLRNHGEHVSMIEMSRKAGCSRKKLAQFFGFVKLYCRSLPEDAVVINRFNNFLDKPRSLNASRGLELSVQEILSPVDVRKKCPDFNGTKDQFICRTLELVKLADSCGVTAERPLKAIIIACAYFSFSSMCPDPIMTLKNFCKVFKLSCYNLEEILKD
ncbi:hypothetical protein NPIL_158381, partial [Nephila pilipes]